MIVPLGIYVSGLLEVSSVVSKISFSLLFGDPDLPTLSVLQGYSAPKFLLSFPKLFINWFMLIVSSASPLYSPYPPKNVSTDSVLSRS